MIYRFKSKLATQDRIIAFLDGELNAPSNLDYEDRFNIEHTSFSHRYSVYRAPQLGLDTFSIRLMFSKHAEPCVLPDLWGLMGHFVCSERFKGIVNDIDNACYQFIPISVTDFKGTEISGDPYYCFYNHRFIEVKVADDREIEDVRNYFPLIDDFGSNGSNACRFHRVSYEEDFIDRLKKESALRGELEQIPIWQHYRTKGLRSRSTQIRSVLYFNEKMHQAIAAASLTGYQLFSCDYGSAEESVIAL